MMGEEGAEAVESEGEFLPGGRGTVGEGSGSGSGSGEMESQLSYGGILSLGAEAAGTGTGWFGSSLLIINAALGAGLLNFPQAFHQAGGILIGTSIQVVSPGFDRN